MSQRRRQNGFTLVEMLAVIVIIGILTGLVTAAVMNVRSRVMRATIKAEINQLALALAAYKAEHGEYPPDGTDEIAFLRHFDIVFPYSEIKFDNDSEDPSQKLKDPSEALVFWLGGPDGNGFSVNPQNPLDKGGPRTTPFFQFDPDRIEDGKYLLDGLKSPFVYFRAENGGYAGKSYDSSEIHGEDHHDDENDGQQPGGAQPDHEHIVTPYMHNNTEWMSAQSFQIITTGLDGKFGKGSDFPSGSDYCSEALDNITSFSNVTLEDEMP